MNLDVSWLTSVFSVVIEVPFYLYHQYVNNAGFSKEHLSHCSGSGSRAKISLLHDATLPLTSSL